MVKITRLPSGSYRTRVHLGGGKYKSITGKDKKEVQLKAAQLEAEVAMSTDVNGASDTKKLKLGDAMDKYMKLKEANLSPSTLRGYRTLRRNSLQSLIDIPLCELNRENVQKAIDEEGRNKSAKTVKNAYGFLTAVLGEYYPDVRLKIELPRAQKTEIVIPTEDEIRQLIEYFKGTDMEVPFMLAAFSAMRASEIRGLKWENIDFKNNRIKVTSAIVLGENSQPVEKLPKSRAGERNIRMFSFVKELLQKAEQKEGYVTTVSLHMLLHRLHAAQEKLGITKFRFHDLRHYCISALIATGAPMQYIIDFVGHVDETMVKRVYGHIMGFKRTEVEDLMEAYFTDRVMKSDTKSVTNS